MGEGDDKDLFVNYGGNKVLEELLHWLKTAEEKINMEQVREEIKKNYLEDFIGGEKIKLRPQMLQW